MWWKLFAGCDIILYWSKAVEMSFTMYIFLETTSIAVFKMTAPITGNAYFYWLVSVLCLHSSVVYLSSLILTEKALYFLWNPEEVINELITLASFYISNLQENGQSATIWHVSNISTHIYINFCIPCVYLDTLVFLKGQIRASNKYQVTIL